MRHRRGVLIGLGCFLLVWLGLSLYLLRDKLHQLAAGKTQAAKADVEPVMDGRPLADWLADLQADDAATRRAAAEALGRLGRSYPKATGVAEALAERLRDEDGGVRRAAADALGQVHLWCRTASGPLREALQDPDPAVRRAAASGLGLVALYEPEVKSALRAALQDRDPTVRVHVAGLLASLTLLTGADLESHLKDPDSTVRTSAIGLLEGEWDSAEWAAAHLCTSLQDPDPEVRREAARVLGAFMHEGTKPAQPALRTALREPDSILRGRAALALCHAGDQSPDLLSPLCEALNDPAPDVRWRAADILGYRCAEAKPPNGDLCARVAVGIIRDAETLRNDPAGVSLQTALHTMQTPAVVKATLPELTRLVKSPDPETRHLAAIGLVLFLEAAQAGKPANLFADPTVRLGPEARPAVAPLVELLGTDNGFWRVEAAFALARIGPGACDAERPLLGALTDGESRVRRAAAVALGRVGASKAAVPALREAMHDPSPAARQAAGLALKAIDPDAAKRAGVE